MTDTNTELVELVADLAVDAAQPPAGGLSPIWPKLIELGLTCVGTPEAAGGSGGTLSDLTVLARALTSKGVSTPLIETAVANQILADTGHELGGATVVVMEQALSEDSPLSLTAVPWARHCDRLITVDTESIGLIDLAAPGVTITPGINIGGDARDQVSAPAGTWKQLSGTAAAADILGRLALLTAAALTGAIDGTYALTRLQVQTRTQFGQPLIEIPAVAGNLAEIKVALLGAEAALDRAIESADITRIGRPTVDSAAVIARVMASRAGTRAARIGHQLHGALGITDEYPLHHYTTRIWAWRDEPFSEARWLTCLGDLALHRGEEALWEQITA